MSLDSRTSRLEAIAHRGDRPRTDILLAWEPGRELDGRGVPILTPDEAAAVAAGSRRLVFILGDPLDVYPRTATFTADGRGGVAAPLRSGHHETTLP
jgi:hypothetical protein